MARRLVNWYVITSFQGTAHASRLSRPLPKSRTRSPRFSRPRSSTPSTHVTSYQTPRCMDDRHTLAHTHTHTRTHSHNTHTTHAHTHTHTYAHTNTTHARPHTRMHARTHTQTHTRARAGWGRGGDNQNMDGEVGLLWRGISHLKFGSTFMTSSVHSLSTCRPLISKRFSSLVNRGSGRRSHAFPVDVNGILVHTI